MAHAWRALGLALALPPLLFVGAASHVGRSMSFHQAHVEITSPWTHLGCYVDSSDPGAFVYDAAANSTSMSVEGCIQFCSPYTYAMLQGAQKCYCANALTHDGARAEASECSVLCADNANKLCGAENRLSVYVRPSVPLPDTAPSVGSWKSIGCYTTFTTAPNLGHPPEVWHKVDTVERCTTACYNSGYHLAGVRNGSECFCDNDFHNGQSIVPRNECNVPCAGNSSEMCGGVHRMNVYNHTGLDSYNHKTLYTRDVSSGPAPVTSGLASPWKYAACYVDNANGRVFSYQVPDNQNLTIESCIQTCKSQNYTLAGTEYAAQCFCGDELIEGAAVANATDCNMGCGGKATEACGGPNRLSVYTATGNVKVIPVPTVQTTGLPGDWAYQGCIIEPGGGRVFPNKIMNTANNTVAACLNQCALFGYPAAGMEFSDECYCGDISDVAGSPGVAPASDCSMPCSGDPAHLCGGPDRLQYYAWNGTLNVWHTPANTGRYEFLIGGVVVPLLVTLGVNNKVAFLEKFGTSELGNSTGAYELDLSLVGNSARAWRTMHVKSDVFCSASIVLPDKGARQLNVGGWSDDSTMGVRLYTPDGSPGVNGTNDWEENWNELHLQRQRWYPSALLLSNGSILVVGGEIGSNGAPEPSLEMLPAPAGGPTWMFLDYLNRTDPNNLYPYLHVLPSGRIFIGYYNEARILDPVSLQTVEVLPNMPGSVTSFLAGRTYPNEGAAVMLPQHAPYTDPVTILICGGSNFGVALDNCVSIQPEATKPAWTIERMPSQRVMPCIAALPDGTYLIVNGAHQGVAGFGLASDPNFSALLYDPTQPVGQRFSILNNTIVARLYHSEATLLNDGRVLISGSDPQTPGLPEEMRIEVYIPPYLTQGHTQPSFTITQTDWAYGGRYAVTVTLHQGTTSTMKVSLIAATSSTHGNAMGGRTIFPQFICVSNTCAITAPPNAKVSPPGWHQLFVLDGPTPSFSKWVRIGGDPAELGNWPAFPDFTLPGV